MHEDRVRVDNGNQSLGQIEKERRERSGKFSKGDPKFHFLLTFWFGFKQGLGIEKTNDQADHKLRCEKKREEKGTKSKIKETDERSDEHEKKILLELSSTRLAFKEKVLQVGSSFFGYSL